MNMMYINAIQLGILAGITFSTVEFLFTSLGDAFPFFIWLKKKKLLRDLVRSLVFGLILGLGRRLITFLFPFIILPTSWGAFILFSLFMGIGVVIFAMFQKSTFKKYSAKEL